MPRLGLLLLCLAACPLVTCSSTPPVNVSCEAPQMLCGMACVNLTDDAAHCGACGAACEQASACVASKCYPRDCAGADCSAAQVCPAGSCIDRACIGVACEAGQVCFQGTCLSTACANTTCAAGHACINGGCIDAACVGVLCPTGRACSSGTCVDTSKCGNGAKDPDEAAVDCGGVCAARCGTGSTCAGGNDCASGLCVAGTCAPQAAPMCTDGRKNATETDVDCGGGCPKCTAGSSCVAHADCASGNCLAGSSRCSDTCANGTKDVNEADVDCGGACTTRCAVDRDCMQASDCASRRCVAGKCTAASCTDLVTDGDETDVDCGGSCPRRCAVDGGCAAGADCFEQVCAGGRCQSPTCTDGKKNGSESDLDCGRMCAMRCMSGQLCLVPNDCAVGQCVAGVCPVLTPSCMDGFLNQDEVDVDCGGTRCTKCGNGRTCRNAGDCLSGFCSKGLTCVAGYSQVRMFGGQMLGLASGDLNADGVSDLISVDNTTLYTWIGQVDAGFLAPTPVSINVVGYSNAVARLADFSGDGRLDALTVATNTGSSEVLLFRGSASGFLAPTVLSAHPPGTNHKSVAVADLDADGRLDVVTAWGGAGVPPGGFVVLKGGPLGLSVATSMTLTGRTPAATSCYGVAVGRLDADALPDLAVGCEPNQVWIALNQGSMVFQLAAMVPTVAGVPHGMVAHDLTNDGNIDIAAGDTGGRISIIVGSGNGTFGAPAVFTVGGWVQHLMMVDLNADNRLDLLAGNSGVAMLLSDGAGGFSVGPSYGLGFYTGGIDTGDFDGDGRRDVCVIGLTNQTGLPNGIICRYQQ